MALKECFNARIRRATMLAQGARHFAIALEKSSGELLHFGCAVGGGEQAVGNEAQMDAPEPLTATFIVPGCLAIPEPQLHRQIHVSPSLYYRAVTRSPE